MHLPFKLSSCEEPLSDNICLSRRIKPFSCRCEYSPFVQHTQSEPSQVGKKLHCGNIVVDNDIELPITSLSGPVIPGFPHTLEQLLNQVADSHRTVTLVAASSRYRELVVDFSCRLTSLGVKNLIIAAMDEEFYRYAFTQGLPVYFEGGPFFPSENLTTQEANSDCGHGSPCFRHYRQVKFHAILQILRRNYSVVWSDVDNVWLRNPLPHLQTFCEGCLLLQSSLSDSSLAPNGLPPDVSDSGGIIFARPLSLITELFEDVLRLLEGKGTKQRFGKSDHPLYSISCGERGEQRAAALDECQFIKKLSVVFLPREEYPVVSNGKVWKRRDVIGECSRAGCYVLHNSLRRGGTAAKMKKLEETDLWRFQAEQRMCRHNWTAKSDAFQALST